jgi:hypothetical protein
LRNIEYINKGQDVFLSLLDRWKSSYFKEQQQKEGSLINIVINRLKEQPIAFYEYSNEALEKRHMTPWFNMIGKRSYDNDIIHDMYLFHECYHIVTLPTNITNNFEQWQQGMWFNECYTSLTTEVFIYHWLPELRKKTFNEEIWFDILKERWGMMNKELLTEEVALLKSLPSPFDKILLLRLEIRGGKAAENKPEEWFARYNNYNDWFSYWKTNYIKVQEIRSRLIETGDWNSVKGLLKEVSTDNIPFKESIKIYK